MKQRNAILFFVLLFSSQAFAQNGVLKGRIYDAKTNQALEFAAILIQGTTISSTTDVEGNYAFIGIEPGFKRLVISLVGYEKTISSEVQVQGNQTAFLDVAMEQTAVQLSEVTVRSTINVKRIESPISVLSIGVQEIEKSAGANRDVLR